MEALSYCVLHIAKVNATTPEEFEAIFEQMTMKAEFLEPFIGAIRGSLGEMRDILSRENERGQIHFKEMNWRLSLVTGCRQR